MNQNSDQKYFHGSLSATLRERGLTQALAKVALVAGVALCFGSMAVAEESKEYHGATNSGHDAPHSGFSYKFAELRYINTTVDDHGADLDGDGFELKGSVALGDRFQAFALYEDIGFDHHIDLSEWAVGFGTHLAVASGADFVAEVGYVSEDISEPGHATHSDEGYLMGIGLRKKIGERGELQLGLNYVDFSEAGSITTYEIAGEMHVLPNLAIGVGINASSADATAYFAEARFYFGGH